MPHLRRHHFMVSVSVLSIVFLVFCSEQARERRDYRRAIREGIAAAETGDAEAQRQLAWLYANYERRTVLGLGWDFSEALKWMTLSAEQGYVDAQQDLGRMYLGTPMDADPEVLLQHGIPKDDAKARHWFQRAANQGDASSQVQIGFYIRKEDRVRSLMWFLLAARDHRRAASIAGIKIHGLKRQLTEAEIATAEQMAAEWTPITENPKLAIEPCN